MSVITVERKVLEKNDIVAEENRKAFKEKKTFTLNLVSSPGSGKTSLVERTAHLSKERFKLGVIEGDVQTNLDAQRVDEYGVPVVQIITNGSCHLDAPLVRNAYNQFEDKEFDDLNEIGAIKSTNQIPHRYPASERSGAAIEFIGMNEYYLKQENILPELKQYSQEVKFHPELMRQIWIDWLDRISMDWPISRRRFYGTEVPV